MTETQESDVKTEVKRGPGRPPKIVSQPKPEVSTGVTLADMPKPEPIDDSADREKLIVDLKAALLPFAKFPVTTDRKPEEVEYKISRDNTTVEITKGNIIAAKKLLNLI